MSNYVPFILPFDNTGQLTSNYLSGNYPIKSISSSGYRQLRLRQGLFFKEGLTITHVESGRRLVEGEDYYLSYEYVAFYQKYNQSLRR